MEKISFSTIRYMLNILRTPSQRKYFWRWLRSLQKDYFLIHKQPWITFDAIDFLETLDLANKRVFEYGSGGSTLYWLSKGAFVVSIEHDRLWYNKVRAMVPPSDRLDYQLVLPEQEPEHGQNTKDPANPDDYISAEYVEQGDHVTYETYVRQIDPFSDDFFDVVLIDGRARPSCIKHSVAKVKHGGLLILDNSDRAYYTQKTAPLLQGFREQIFFSPLPQCTNTKTSIYTRQNEKT